jgi:hypothetical protein
MPEEEWTIGQSHSAEVSQDGHKDSSCWLIYNQRAALASRHLQRLLPTDEALELPRHQASGAEDEAEGLAALPRLPASQDPQSRPQDRSEIS